MKILHSGDWHLGNFPGPEIDGENARFLDICNCLDSLVKTATEQAPDIIVIAGDVFHQAKVWSDRGLKENRTAAHYIKILEKLAPVIIVRGTPNHDSEEQYANLDNAFRGDDSVHFITTPTVLNIWSYKGEKIQIAALPGFDRGFYRANHPGLSKEEENEVFTEELKNIIVGLKAQCEPDIPSVLVSHFTIPGCNMESGQTQFFSQFEPVVHLETLQTANFDLVCFGHIHRPQAIPNVKATYYCGAISALNFNDEGQERGFYIHEIKEDRSVESRFFKTPTREYFTLRMENSDVAAFNSDGMLDVTSEDVKDKIVRVIYNCTDENNKTLNKSAMVQELYKMEAFWVQEITPEKISVSVNRNGLSDESSPEENLHRYFIEKGYEEDRIAEIIEVARPYIASAIASVSRGAKTGVFSPKRIEVKNYRNYRNEVFEYEGIHFCTINGENGAGKSSLFMDAMLDALYEEPREGDLTGWICNDPDVRSGSIQFTFNIGEAEYRVTRTRQKSGKATLNISEFVDGEWIDRSAEKFKDTQAIIEETIGMDSLTLKACGLIMQDQYGLFLQADKEARITILGNIIGLGIYDKMEDLAAEALTLKNREIRTINDQVTAVKSMMPDEEKLSIDIDEAEKKSKDLTAEIDEKNAEIDSVKVRYNSMREASERASKLLKQIDDIKRKKSNANFSLSTYMLTKNNAESTIASEAVIMAGVANYESLCEQEKALISAIDRRDDLLKQKQKKQRDLDSLSAEITSLEADTSQEKAKLAELELKLSGEAELEEKHRQYIETQEEVSYMRKLFEEKSELENSLSSASLNLKEISGKYEVEKKGLVSEIISLEKRVEILENSGCTNIEKATCKFLEDALAAKAILPSKKAELDLLESEAKEATQKAQKAVDTALELLNANSYSSEEMRRLNSILEALKTHEEIYVNLEAYKVKAETSKASLYKISDRIKVLEIQRQEAESELRETESQLATAENSALEGERLRSQIEEAKVYLSMAQEIPVAKERLKNATQRIAELKDEIAQMDIDIAEKSAEYEKEKLATIGIEHLESAVKTTQIVIDDLMKQREQNAMHLGALYKQAEQIEEANRTIDGLSKQAVEIGRLAAIDDDLKKAFSQDGVPHNVIRSIIPAFEATASAILGQMSAGKMNVEFVTEKVLKSNNKKEVTTLDIVINDYNTGRLPYMSRSGGERVKAALSVILALSEIKSTKAGVQLGFLFIDEAPFLDESGTQAYVDALETIQNRYSNTKIMAITHDESFKARFPQNVTIYRDEDGSHVRKELQ